MSAAPRSLVRPPDPTPVISFRNSCRGHLLRWPSSMLTAPSHSTPKLLALPHECHSPARYKRPLSEAGPPPGHQASREKLPQLLAPCLTPVIPDPLSFGELRVCFCFFSLPHAFFVSFS